MSSCIPFFVIFLEKIFTSIFFFFFFLIWKWPNNPWVKIVLRVVKFSKNKHLNTHIYSNLLHTSQARLHENFTSCGNFYLFFFSTNHSKLFLYVYIYIYFAVSWLIGAICMYTIQDCRVCEKNFRLFQACNSKKWALGCLDW